MLEARGNLWTYPTDIIIITTNGFVKNNGEAVMGRGCALEATKLFPGIAKELGSAIKKRGNIVLPLRNNLWTMPVKHNWWEPADIDLIIKSCHQLIEMTGEPRPINLRFLMPRPGCGNGHLNWADVKPIIEPILDDRFTVITF